MEIAISGATGLLGRHLADRIGASGNTVRCLRRSNPTRSASDIAWNPTTGEVDLDRLEGVDAVVHLAGENIAGGRWTEERRRKIRDSRVNGTRALGKAVLSLQRVPKVFLSCSAIGYYGDRGEKVLTEEDAPGVGFLASVCQDWEASADILEGTCVRLVKMRLGVVLTPEGGALATMLPPFRWGVGGPLGSGRQYFSWIALTDVVRAMEHCLTDESCHGAVNMASPNPVTNREFTRALGVALHRPTLLPLPRWAARLALGAMADEMLFFSQRVLPSRLLEGGFRFEFPTIDNALQAMLKS